MKMMVIVQVEFDEKEEGVDCMSDAEHRARMLSFEELRKDDDEDPKVYYVVM